MCGYLRRHIGPKDLKEFLKLIGMPQLELPLPEDGLAQHFYPAWGAVPEKQIKGLIVLEDGRPKVVDATWWYACDELGDTLRPNMAKQTLNARRLHLDIWQEPLRHRRASQSRQQSEKQLAPRERKSVFSWKANVRYC